MPGLAPRKTWPGRNSRRKAGGVLDTFFNTLLAGSGNSRNGVVSNRPVYLAIGIDDQAAAAALEVFAGNWQDRYPAIVKVWRAHWEQFTPFLAFPPEVRDPQLRVETGAAGIHDLLRRTNPDPMTATINYTDGRTPPAKCLGFRGRTVRCPYGNLACGGLS
jgi:hypothetical protein